MKMHCTWVMELVAGESEGKKIPTLLGKNKTTQRQEEMRGGEVKKGQGKRHELVVLVTDNLRVVLIPFGSAL